MHRELTKGVYYVGVDDHHTEYFENLWKLPFGVSYNSYLIVDEKIAIVELVKGPWAQEWIDNIKEIVDPQDIDYIIMNHMEPDHTGALPEIAKIATNATMVYTRMASGMQESFYDVPLEEKIVGDLEEISLGEKTLKFVHAKFLHWPETMMTYLAEDKILFSCDAFGSYGALNGKHFDNEIDLRMVEHESRRYLSSIITSYLKFIQRGIQKVKNLGIAIEMIAPSHGPIYRDDPMWIVERFDRWSSPELENDCTIVYGTMYGFTHRVAYKLKKALEENGVNVKIHNIAYSDMSDIIVDTMRTGVIVIGSPTYDAYPFPPIGTFVDELEGKRFAQRPMGLFGNYGWGGGAIRKLKPRLSDNGFEILDPIIRVRGRPNKEEEEQIQQLAKAIASKLA